MPQKWRLYDFCFKYIGLKFGQLVGLPEDVIQRASEVSYNVSDLQLYKQK